MKIVLVLMLGLAASSVSFAQSVVDTTSPEVTLKTNQQAIQLYIRPVTSVATINFLDAQGHVLYTVKTSLAKGFQQQFDVSSLEAGAYQLAIQTDQQLISKPFVIKEQSIQRQVSLQV